MNKKPLTIILSATLLLAIVSGLPNHISLAHASGGFTVTAGSSTVGPISTQGSGTTSITVSALSSFTGTVSLTNTISPPTGITAGLSPSSVTLSATTTTANSILSVNGSAVGTYTVTVKGTSGTLVNSTQISVTVVQGGLVCIASFPAPPPPANPCPAAPGPIIRGLPPATPPRQLKIGVYVNASDPLNSFDITLIADHTILLPIDASLVGTILQGAGSPLIKCVGGVNQISSSQCPPTDTVDTIELAAAGSCCAGPTTGLFFTATYNITGSTTIAGISLGFQTSCLNTSVRNTCISVGAGTAGVVPERSQGATFANAPDFSITTNPAQVSFAATLTGTSTLTARSLSTFAGTVAFAATTNSTNLSVSFNPTQVTLTSGASLTSTVTFSSSVVANYTATLTGTSGSISHSINVTVSVVPRFDFSLSANPNTVTFDNSTSGTSTITVNSVTGFVGFVDLSSAISPATGLSVVFNPTNLKLPSLGSTNSSIATFSSSAPGNYVVTVTGQNGTSPPVHRITILVHVADFNITAKPSTVIVYEGAVSNSTIGVASRFKFAGSVSLSSTVNATGLTATFGNSVLILRAGGINNTLLSLTGTFGNYTVTILAVSGPISHTTTLIVTVRHPDFAIAASPPHVIDLVSSSNSTLVSVIRLGSFNGTISLSSTTIPGVTITFSLLSITLSPSVHSAISNMTITAAGTATPGDHALIITGVNSTGSPTHTTPILLTILQPDFLQSLNANSIEINVGQNANSTLQLFSLNNFAGTVTLQASVAPSGLTTTFNQTSVVLVIRGAGGASITIAAPVGTVPGNYTVTITETSGSLIHTSTIAMIIGDFQIITTTPTIVVNVGYNNNANFTVSSINHFKGNVTLAFNPSSSNLGGTLSATPINLRIDSSKIVYIMIAAPNNTATGTFSVVLQGTIGPVTHLVTISVTVILHDVSITAVAFSPSTVTSGGTETYTITVHNGGNVTENVTVEALAGFIMVNEANITLASGATQTITLTWNTNGFNPGSYSLGAKVLSVPGEATTANNIMTSSSTFTLNSAPQPLISQDLLLIIAVIAAIAVVIIAAALLVRRRKPSPSIQSSGQKI